MTIKASGSLAINELAAEFGGGAAPYSMSQFYRGGSRVPNGPAANSGIATAGAIAIGSFYNSVAEVQIAINTNRTNLNLLSEFTSTFGAPSGAVVVRFIIGAAVVIGGVSGGVALTVGQFPTSSAIIIDNNGSIQGYGGAAGTAGAGGAGGDAIKADYPNQTVTINNASGATIYAGGGGGGKGGAGGTGGQGSYLYVAYVGDANDIGGNTYDDACVAQRGTGTWCGGGQGYVAGCSSYDEYGNCIQYLYKCNVCYGYANAYSSGGTGGAGGNGGQGQGYSQSNATGSAAAVGAAGGTNAGTGGTSGKGGDGAAWGGTGGVGNNGLVGANGNYTSGVAGASGLSGGPPGRYLVKGAYSVTLNNAGNVLGTLA